ncbi:hypothetical protein HYH02_002121 [Chlamydomonas schloesseri]|uniref:CCT domain-containing protein n=1 Tax=Chlamydomonas schloesseri TaxID=2026947 RepID=A0A835WVD0_9CHLO|nr:hypothetical protein HYH02_002121 [Chlamydomonas schloesseri]|eukprot:KAG2453918.1 hypothetical protein HYH02_002121 [Chlamydomonas schloesseri]
MSDAFTCADVATAAAGGPAAYGCCHGEGEPGGGFGGQQGQHAADDVANGPAVAAAAHSAGSSFAPCDNSVGCMPAGPTGTASPTAPRLPAAPRVAGKWPGVGAAAAAQAAAAACFANSREDPEQPEEGEAEALETTEDLENEQDAEEDEEDEDADVQDRCAAIPDGAAAAGHLEEAVLVVAPLRRPPSRAAGGLCAACSGAVPLCEVAAAAAPPCALGQDEAAAGSAAGGFSFGCCDGSGHNCSEGAPAATTAVRPCTACKACAAALPAHCGWTSSSAASDEDGEEMLLDDAPEAEVPITVDASLAARRVGGGGSGSASQAAGDNLLVPLWGHAKAAVVAGKQLDRGAAAACACFGKWCGYVSALRGGQLTSSGHAALQRDDGTVATELAAAAAEAGEAAVAVPAELFMQQAEAVVSRQGSYSASVYELQPALRQQDDVAPAAGDKHLPAAGALALHQQQHAADAPIQQPQALTQHQGQALPLAVAAGPAAAAAASGTEAHGDDMFAGMAGLSEQEQRRILLQQLEELRLQEQARLHAMHMHWLQQQEAMHVQLHMQAQQLQLVQQMQLACAQPPHPVQHPQQEQQSQQQQREVQLSNAADMDIEGNSPGLPVSLTPTQQAAVLALPQQPLLPQQHVHVHMPPAEPPYAVQQYQRYLAEQYQGAFPVSETNATSSPFASASSAVAVAPSTPFTPSADAALPAPPAAAATATAAPLTPLPAPTAAQAAARAPVQPMALRPAQQSSQQGAGLPRGPSLSGGIRKPVPPPVITVIRRGPDGSILQKSSPPTPPAVRRSMSGRRDDVAAPAGQAAPGAAAPKVTAPAAAASTGTGAAAAPAAAQPRTTPAYAPVTTPAATAYAAQVLAAAAAAAAGMSGGGQRELTRQERVARYLEKRKRRNFDKVIRYATRKYYAEVRPRIRGRFARREEIEAWKMAHGGPDVEVPAVLDDD